MARIEASMQATKPCQTSPLSYLIPESIDAQLPSGTRLRFRFDESLMTSDAGLVLLAEHATRSGDIAPIAAALARKLKDPACSFSGRQLSN